MTFSMLHRALSGYFRNDCPLAAAAVAYYVLLSVFPLILLVITIGSSILPPSVVERQLLEFVNQYAAGSRGTLRGVIRGLGQHSTSLSLLAVAGLAWSGMGIIGALRTALNLAYGIRESRPFWVQRRLEVVFALLLGALFLGSSVVGWAVDATFVPGHHGARGALSLIRLLVGTAVAFAGFSLCYAMLPDVGRRTWRASLLAAAAATALFVLAKWIFLAWVSGIANYSLVYGAVGAVIILLVWSYAGASILLFGGQLARELEVKPSGVVPAP